MGLEDDLESQLSIKGFTRSDSRRAVKTANGRREIQSVVVGVVRVEEAVAVGDRRGKICAVEQVEHFHPELCGHPFPNQRSVFEYRKVNIPESWTDVGIAPGIDKSPWRRIDKGRRIQPQTVDLRLLEARVRAHSRYSISPLYTFVRT